MRSPFVYALAAMIVVAALPAFVPTASAATLIYPRGGEFIRGTVTFTWSPGGSSELVLYASGAPLAPSLCDPCVRNSYVFDSTRFADGSEYVLLVKQDSSGGDGNNRATTSGTFTIDNTRPATGATLHGAPGASGWFTGDVTVALSASDATSGVASTLLSIDGAAAVPVVDATRVAGDGLHVAAFWSVDRAGNVEAKRTISFGIDGTAPASAVAIGAPSVDAGRVTYVTSATPIALSASDETSGVARIEYRLDAGAFRAYTGAITVTGEDGEHLLEWRAVDVAGNVEGAQYARLRLDNAAPALAIAHPQAGGVYADDTVVVETLPARAAAGEAAVANDGTTVETVRFAVAAGNLTVGASTTDAGVGVARVDFLVDGVLRATVAEAPYAWTWDTRGEVAGEHVLQVVSTDRLGNAASRSIEVEVVPLSAEGALATVANGGPNVPASAAERVPAAP